MTIHIESLTFDAIIGILDFERVTPQKVIIDMEIDYEYTEKTFINYVDIIETVQGLMKKNQYQLLEEALGNIAKSIKEEYFQINSFYIKISKPDIIPNTTVSVSKKYF